MKFRFCGDLDAPEWLLREISSLSQMTYVRIKLLIMHILNHTLGQCAVDMEKVKKLVSTANFTASDIHGAIAAIQFILRGAAQYDVVPEALAAELTQIGLPAEHCRAFQKAYATQKDELKAKLEGSTMTQPRLSEIHWRVDYILSCNGIKGVNSPAAQIKLKLTNGEMATFTLTADKLRILLADLKEARDIVNSQ